MVHAPDRHAARQGGGSDPIPGDQEPQAELAQRNAKDLVETLLGLPVAPDPDQAPAPVLHVTGDAQVRCSCTHIRCPVSF